MSNKKQTGRNVDRRHLIKSASALVAGMVLAGCGSDESSADAATAPADSAAAPPPLMPPAHTTSVTGTLNTTEVTGPGLRVVSAYQLNAPVKSGAFTTFTSDSGSQLLFVTDNAKNLRALTVAIPGQNVGKIDAETTAAALVFMNSFVLTIVPAEAIDRLALIRSLPSFSPFVAFIRANLPQKTVAEVVALPDFTVLRDLVTTDLGALPTSKPLSAQQHILARLGAEGVTATYTRPGEGRVAGKVDLANHSSRFVSVVRQQLDANGKEVGEGHAVPQFFNSQVLGTGTNLLGGQNGISLGNILTRQVGNPGSATDVLDVTKLQGVTKLVYWVRGPGFGGPSLPATIPASLFNTKTATLSSIIFYVVAPLLDGLGGLTSLLQETKAVAELSAAVSANGISTAGVDMALSSGDKKGIAGAIADLLGGLVPAIALVPGYVEALPALGVALGVIGAVQGLFAAQNVASFVTTLLLQPGTDMVDVPISMSPRFTAKILAVKHAISPSANRRVTRFNASINDVGNVLYVMERGTSTRFKLLLSTDIRNPIEQVLISPDPSGVISRLNGADHFAVGGSGRVYFWDGESFKDIGNFNGQVGVNGVQVGDLSELDEIVGTFQLPTTAFSAMRAFRWQVGPGLQDTGISVPFDQPGISVNDNKQIAYLQLPPLKLAKEGAYVIDSPGKQRVVIESLIDNELFASRDQDSPNFIFAGTLINNSGTVVFGDDYSPIKVWKDGKISILRHLNEKNTRLDFTTVHGLNDQGWIVGRSIRDAGDIVPTLWIDGQPLELSKLVETPAEGMGDLVEVAAINNRGQILCLGGVGNSTNQLILLTPKS